jgi:hypothetical protein
MTRFEKNRKRAKRPVPDSRLKAKFGTELRISRLKNANSSQNLRVRSAKALENTAGTPFPVFFSSEKNRLDRSFQRKIYRTQFFQPFFPANSE